jgi:MraZ protein
VFLCGEKVEFFVQLWGIVEVLGQKVTQTNWGQTVFRGINTINLDAKGRMAMPARYREQLVTSCSGHLVVTIDTNHRCLLLYPLQEWEQIERQIESLSSFDPMSQRVKHLLIGHANDLELDNSGRILLPQELRQYAQLEKHVCLIGQGKKLEIWDQASWTEQRDHWLTENSTEGELPEKLRTLAL